MRILFITATRLGDAVLSTALVEHLRARYPQARFTIACGPVAAGLWDRLPGLERVIVLEKRRFDLHWALLWMRAATTLWDLAVDLRGSAVTLLLAARRRRIMRGGRRPGHRLTHLAGVLGLDPATLRTAVWTAAEDDAAAAAVLPDGPSYFALGPTANWAGKVWPAERFVSLYRLVTARAGGEWRPAVFAGPGEAERALAADVLAGLPDAIDLQGRLGLPAIASALRRASLFAGNDSGLMHLAAAAGAPTLGLFGPSRASEYAPVGRNARCVVSPGPEGAAPIMGITVERAAEAALSLLQARPLLQSRPG